MKRWNYELETLETCFGRLELVLDFPTYSKQFQPNPSRSNLPAEFQRQRESALHRLGALSRTLGQVLSG